jgi:hypothetical protein
MKGGLEIDLEPKLMIPYWSNILSDRGAEAVVGHGEVGGLCW